MLQSPSQLAALNHDSSDKSLRHVPPAPFISIFVGAALMSIASLGCIARLLRVIFSSQASRRTLGVPTVALAPPPLEQAAAPGGYLSATAGFDSATYLLEAGDAGVQLVVRPNRHGLATLLDALEESLRTHRVCKASLVGEWRGPTNQVSTSSGASRWASPTLREENCASGFRWSFSGRGGHVFVCGSLALNALFAACVVRKNGVGRDVDIASGRVRPRDGMLYDDSELVEAMKFLGEK
jgi:hypothetical protein